MPTATASAPAREKMLEQHMPERCEVLAEALVASLNGKGDES